MSEMLHAVLTAPAVAVGLGLAIGVAMLLVSRASFRAVTPENPAGLLVAAGLLFGRMVVAVTLLYLYHRFARGGFAAFAAALAVGFIALYWVELVRYSGLLKKRPRVAGQPR